MMRGVWTSLLPIILPALVLSSALGQGGHPAPAAQVQYRVTGTLVSSVDGSPIPHGHLRAILAGSGAQARQNSPWSGVFDADDQGRFTIQLPSAGTWSLTAWGQGFVRNGYLGHGEFSSGIELTREHPAMDIRFVLVPQAEIMGVVTDEAGETVRGAHVTLMRVGSGPSESVGQTGRQYQTQTDDRGMYEFDELEPGNYRLCVTAQPWYAVAAAQSRENDSPLDPSLDVAYPVTWFPGTSDPDEAEVMALPSGNVREADFHLLPIPALHLIIDPPAGQQGVRNASFFPVVQRIDGENFFVKPVVRTNSQGQIDVGGLTPGLYQVQLLGPGNPNQRRVVRITGSGSQTLSFDGESNEAEVHVQFEGISEDEARSLSASLVDLAGRTAATTRNGIAAFDTFRQGTAMFRRGGGRSAAPGEAPFANRANRQARQELVLQVPPGKYDVVLRAARGDADIYLSAITAKGAQVTGRQVTLPAGASTLTLHVVEGRATLTGMIARDGKPSVGTLVMLVPATLGETGAMQIVRRDESNTDGSFNIANIIPGQYILIAVEDGWDINWSDTATLSRYLGGGVAVNLPAKSRVTQNITAQRP